ncbi:hypothetical protein ACETK8_13705 [Brevundimonas staleyi]|uniref:Uncharacterized protein n=1 Tax=Brevundimonas staleyi TaxID=74326 RepID=A0ABW0FW08_9CAUL
MVRILTAHMSSEEMCESMTALIDEKVIDPTLVDGCRRAVNVFRRLRSYRNFYIHEPVRGLLLDMQHPHTVRIGTQGIETRKGGSSRFGGVTQAQLEQGIEWCHGLSSYLNWIVQEAISIQSKSARPEMRFQAGQLVRNTEPPELEIPPEFKHPSKVP